MSISRVYRLDEYSIPELLQLLRTERGERIRLETGLQPSLSLTIKGKEYEIDGPPLDEEAAEKLLRPVVDSRQMRAFRQFGTVDIVYTFKGARFIIRVVRAFGIFNVELHAVKA
jgi:Tfp pilus assembly pilus retraction ATPase PilT